MSKHFSDIGKDSRDLLSDDFPSEGTVKFTTESKTSNGITSKVNFRRYLKGGREQVDATIEPKFEWKEKNIELSGKFTSTSDFTANVAVKDLVKGSKIEVSGNSNEKSTTSKVVLSYKTDPFATKATLTVPVDSSSKKPPPKINGEVVIQYPDNLHVGGNVLLDLNEKAGVKVEGVVGYSKDLWQITGRGSYSPPPTLRDSPVVLWGFSFFHKFSENLKWTFDIDTDTAFKRGPIGVVAGHYKVDDFTSLKLKGTLKVPDLTKQPEARIGLSAKQKINPNLFATFGADLNAHNVLRGDADGHSFGLELKLQ